MLVILLTVSETLYCKPTFCSSRVCSLILPMVVDCLIDPSNSFVLPTAPMISLAPVYSPRKSLTAGRLSNFLSFNIPVEIPLRVLSLNMSEGFMFALEKVFTFPIIFCNASIASFSPNWDTPPAAAAADSLFASILSIAASYFFCFSRSGDPSAFFRGSQSSLDAR